MKVRLISVCIDLMLLVKYFTVNLLFFIYDHWVQVPFDKQLLDEVEHDIMSYQNRGLCYLSKPKAEADNTDARF